MRNILEAGFQNYTWESKWKTQGASKDALESNSFHGIELHRKSRCKEQSSLRQCFPQ